MLKILGLQVFDGPSVYSHKPVARLRLKMGKCLDRPSNEMPGLYERLTTDFPGLKAHHCSRDHEGGFLERLQEGTYLPHIIEHLCLEVQSCLGHDVRYGKARTTEDDDCYDIIFAYKDERLVEPVVRFVLDYIKCFLAGKTFDISGRFKQLEDIRRLERTVGQEKGNALVVAFAGDDDSPAFLTAGMLDAYGMKVGVAASRGIYINGIRKSRRNAVCKSAARQVINIPDLDVALIETDTRHILDEGLAYHKASVAVLCSLIDGHLGRKHVEDIEDLIYIKSLTIEAVRPEGFCILNADEPYITDLLDRARGNIVLYGLNKQSAVMQEHIKTGGEAICCFNDGIYCIKEGIETRLLGYEDIAGTDLSMALLGNMMAAIAVCRALCIPWSSIPSLALKQLRSKRQSRGQVINIPRPAYYKARW